MHYDIAYSRIRDAEPDNAKRVGDEVARIFGRALLGVQQAPEAHIDFVCRVLSDPFVVNRPGVAGIISDLGIEEEEKLTAVQWTRIFKCAAEHFGLVKDESVAFVVGDMVARNALSKDTLHWLQRMTDNATSATALKGVWLGLDFLTWLDNDPNSDWWKAIGAVAKSAERREAMLNGTL